MIAALFDSEGSDNAALLCLLLGAPPHTGFSYIDEEMIVLPPSPSLLTNKPDSYT